MYLACRHSCLEVNLFSERRNPAQEKQKYCSKHRKNMTILKNIVPASKRSLLIRCRVYATTIMSAFESYRNCGYAASDIVWDDLEPSSSEPTDAEIDLLFGPSEPTDA